MSLPIIAEPWKLLREKEEKEFRNSGFRDYFDELRRTDHKLVRKLEGEEKLFHHVKESYYYISQEDDIELWMLIDFLHNRHAENWEVSALHYPVVLDVGAGTGSKVKMFKDCGIPAAGIEFQYEYIKLGREAFGLSHEELLWMNAFNITEEFLRGFSVIYTYMPLRDGKRMTELHNLLWQKAQYGTIFVEMLPRYYPMNMARNLGGFWVTEKASYYYD